MYDEPTHLRLFEFDSGFSESGDVDEVAVDDGGMDADVEGSGDGGRMDANVEGNFIFLRRRIVHSLRYLIKLKSMKKRRVLDSIN